MKGKGNLAWGGIAGGFAIKGDIDFADGTRINIVGKVFGLGIGAGAATPDAGAVDIDFKNPSSLKSGHYFTSLTTGQAVYGGGVFAWAEHLGSPAVGYAIFSGLGLGLAVAMGDSELTVTKAG